MRNFVIIGVGLILALLVYLVFWPSTIQPVAWSPTPARPLDGALAPNNALADAELIDLGDVRGPEDIAYLEKDGELMLYASTREGFILEINPATQDVRQFAETGGNPLGLAFDAQGNLIVGDSSFGLLSVSPEGDVSVLTNTVDGQPIHFADDMDFGADGTIYFSDATVKFGDDERFEHSDGAALEILEHGRTGRILAYNPETRSTQVFFDELSFPNGVATAHDGQSILVAETGEYRVVRIYIDGPLKGTLEDVVTGLPGFPDNVDRGPILPDGTPTYYMGLAALRIPALDQYAEWPLIRKIASRLPEIQRSGDAAKGYGFIIQFTEQGEIIDSWQDEEGRFPETTGAVLPGDGFLYITNIESPFIPRIPYD
ncbi:MAG: SMP-30/gluconolactonase/LRE family protein [Pseudomonadota bacterium]